MARAYEAIPCPCCHDTGIYPLGTDDGDEWRECACDAGTVRLEYLGADAVISGEEIDAWTEAERARP